MDISSYIYAVSIIIIIISIVISYIPNYSKSGIILFIIGTIILLLSVVSMIV